MSGIRLGWSDLTAKGRAAIWRCLLAEFLGCMFINLLGCAAGVALPDKSAASNVLISLNAGFVIASVVQVVCHVSGGHVNPAVTFAMLVTCHISVVKALLYIVAQCLGSTAGAAILRALTPSDIAPTKLGITAIHSSLDPLQGLGMEFFLGFMLLYVVSGVCDHHRGDVRVAPPLAIGLAAAACHFAALNFTGSSVNPARTFGSSVIANHWENHWVYWVGPSCGGMTAALIYKYCFSALPSGSGVTEYNMVRVQDKELSSLEGQRVNNP